MDEHSSKLKDTIEELKKHREELQLQLHLAKSDIKDEWDELEEKMVHLQSKFSTLKKEAAESSKEIGVALSLVADEIAEAYKRIKRRLKEK